MAADGTALSFGRPEGMVGGRYRLEELVGRGGSAEVWAARDEALERRVAVKLVTVSGGEDAGRVGDEARLLAKLSAPGLVPVYDAGTDEGGRPWVVMELVVGETLADAVARGPLASDRVASVGRVLAEALAYVHGEGLVHRDVKPANVLLGRDGRVRLTDFGIARLVDAAKVTATGLTVGTASYLSPEQVTGAHVGPLSDVYSLGLVLLECLKGEREYPGSAVEVALARLSRQPVVPPTLPAGWPGLLTAMTARETGPRPTAGEAARELARIAAGGEATTVLTPRTGPPRGPDATQVLPVVTAPQAVLGRPPSAAQVQSTYAQPTYPQPGYPQPAGAAPRVRPAPPSGSAWPWVLLLLAVIAAAVVGFLVYDRVSSDPGTAPASVRSDLPSPLRSDLQKLQDLVAS